jgi:hypothetical protein
MVEIAAAMGALKTISRIATEAQKIEITAQVIELQQTLLTLLAQNTEMAGKINALEATLRDREARLQRQEEFAFSRNSYWMVNGEDSIGPFCSRCFDVDDKPVRMHPTHEGFYRCPGCKNSTLVDKSEQIDHNSPLRVSRSGWVTDWRR